MIPNSKVITALALALCATAADAVFPPYWALPTNSVAVSRAFLFSSTFGGINSSPVLIDGGRLLAEVLLIWCVVGLLLLYWWCD